MTHGQNQTYQRIREALRGSRLPAALVDMDAFDRNIAYVARTQTRGKTIRVASKSIRSVDLLRRVFEKGGAAFQGVLAFTVEEADMLRRNGFDDIIVAYPSVQASDMDLLVKAAADGGKIIAMADSLDHLEAMDAAGRAAGVVLSACLDIDMSYRPLGLGAAHIGVRRSPIRSVADVAELGRRAAGLEYVKVEAVMGYEAQVAGVGDDVPGHALKNKLLRLIKGRSMTELSIRRGEVVAALKAAGLPITRVNGGGSGSLYSTGADDSVTEVAAGSAFYCPALFRHYHEVKFHPAAYFAVQVVRKPADGIVTCLGGGYCASGAAGPDRLPVPVLPRGLKLLGLEGAGEVQTPLAVPTGAPELRLGDPVLFQHAKAGELCERFNSLLLIKDYKIIGEARTYRGQGFAFL